MRAVIFIICLVVLIVVPWTIIVLGVYNVVWYALFQGAWVKQKRYGEKARISCIIRWVGGYIVLSYLYMVALYFFIYTNIFTLWKRKKNH